MKRLTTAMMVGAVATLLAASTANAQYVYFGGGANIPTGSFKDGVKTGWIASAGGGADVGKKGLWVEAEGWYGQNKWKTDATSPYDEPGKTKLWSALGVLGYDLMHDKKWTPYLAAGAGGEVRRPLLIVHEVVAEHAERRPQLGLARLIVRRSSIGLPLVLAVPALGLYPQAFLTDIRAQTGSGDPASLDTVLEASGGDVRPAPEIHVLRVR